MHAVKRQSGPRCILCTLRHSAAFSILGLGAKANHKENDRRRYNFDEKHVDAALLSDRWDGPRQNHRLLAERDARKSITKFLPNDAALESRRGSQIYAWRPKVEYGATIQDSTLVRFGAKKPDSPLIGSGRRKPRTMRNRSGLLVQKAGEKALRSFEGELDTALQQLEETIPSDTIFTRLNIGNAILGKIWTSWRDKLVECLTNKKNSDPTFARLKRVWPSCNSYVFFLYVKYAFYGKCMPARFSQPDQEDQEELANMRFPTEWFPATRGFQREFHLHVGPTNSGKTYHALKRLEQAETGLYAGPLRLLAHEVYMRLNAAGSRCNLITGDERRACDDDPEAPMTSCTVEMVPLNAKLDVAVLDEIQMIGSEDRGWAWTQAVLGVMAKEVHCCGEERTIPIMKELAAMCGEKLHIHRYKRLSPLEMAFQSLDGDLRKLQKGDCIVAFRIMEIHALRQMIQKRLKVKVAVIYGSLPPETRAQQARLFNDPDSGYDILVASNAIGMGLNLSIKRLVFQTSTKFDGTNWKTLNAAETKQIAGRAGRYSTAEQDMKKKPVESNLDIVPSYPVDVENAATTKRPSSNASVGYVTTLENFDFPIIKALMETEPELITSAGIQAPTYVIERFAKYFPANTPFTYILMKLSDITETSARFFMCDLRTALAIADVIESVEGLTTTDRLIFCSSPVEPRKPGEPELARAYARLVAENRVASIIDIQELDLDLLDDDFVADRSYLSKLENLHKGIIIWNWLSFRFAGVFINPELAQHVKGLVEARIEEVLQRLTLDYNKMRKAREQAVIDLLANAQDEGGEEDMEDVDVAVEETEIDTSGEELHDEPFGDEPDNEVISLDRSEPEVAELDETLVGEPDLQETEDGAPSANPTISDIEVSESEVRPAGVVDSSPDHVEDISPASKEHWTAASAPQ